MLDRVFRDALCSPRTQGWSRRRAFVTTETPLLPAYAGIQGCTEAEASPSPLEGRFIPAGLFDKAAVQADRGRP